MNRTITYPGHQNRDSVDIWLQLPCLLFRYTPCRALVFEWPFFWFFRCIDPRAWLEVHVRYLVHVGDPDQDSAYIEISNQEKKNKGKIFKFFKYLFFRNYFFPKNQNPLNPALMTASPAPAEWGAAPEEHREEIIPAETAPAAAALLQSFKSKAIISLSLILVTQYFVGSRNF